MDKITVDIDPEKLVITTSNDGGYLGGECLICGEMGWTNGPDCYKHMGTGKIDRGLSNQLVHKNDCPVGTYIRTKGL